MAQRLVTRDDLNDHPELQKKGISLNMYYDFDRYEIIDIPTVNQSESVPIETISVQTINEEIVIPKEDLPKPKVKKPTPKKAATTNKK